MITQLKLKNYKRFKEATFNFGDRLTMIYGPNSSGKSSVLRALQILRQAWEHDRFLYLKPQGANYSFSRFEHLVSKSIRDGVVEEPEDDLYFEITTTNTFAQHGHQHLYTVGLTYNEVEDTHNGELNTLMVRRELVDLSIEEEDRQPRKTFEFTLDIQPCPFEESRFYNQYSALLSEECISQKKWETILGGTQVSDELYALDVREMASQNSNLLDQVKSLIQKKSADVPKAYYSLRLIRPWDTFFQDKSFILQVESNNRLLFEAKVGTHSITEELEISNVVWYVEFELDEQQKYQVLERLAEALDSFEYAFWAMYMVGGHLKLVNAIGPSRSVPQYVYSYKLVNFVGFAGEDFSSLMFSNKQMGTVLTLVNQSILQMGVPYQLCASDVEGIQFGQPLQEVWLQRLQTDHLGRVLIEDGIPKVLDDVNVALPDLGFGLSQMLPILTQYHYQAEEQDSLSLSTLTVEQPELHLHPSWQAELAQILSGAVKEGEEPQSVTQMIVETHSEHFIQRIRNIFLSVMSIIVSVKI